MVIIYDTRLMGKVDQVESLGYVATQFLHLYYIPLIPTGSYLVFSEAGDDFRGISIGLSFKSVLVAWLRAACFFGCIGMGIAAFIHFVDPKLEWWKGLAFGFVSAFAIGTFIATYYLSLISKASYDRAMYLAQRVGVSEEGLLMLEIAYGRKTAEQADWELQQIEAKQAAKMEVYNAEPAGNSGTNPSQPYNPFA